MLNELRTHTRRFVSPEAEVSAWRRRAYIMVLLGIVVGFFSIGHANSRDMPWQLFFMTLLGGGAGFTLLRWRHALGARHTKLLWRENRAQTLREIDALQNQIDELNQQLSGLTRT